MDTQNTSAMSSLIRWIRESVMIKIFIIGILTLFLLIPTLWIIAVIEERQGRRNEAVEEVTHKWADAQYVTGPVWVLPYKKSVITRVSSDGKRQEEKTE